MHTKFHANRHINVVFIYIWNFKVATILSQDGGSSSWTTFIGILKMPFFLLNLSKIVYKCVFLFKSIIKNDSHLEKWWRVKLTDKTSRDFSKACAFTEFPPNRFITLTLVQIQNFKVATILKHDYGRSSSTKSVKDLSMTALYATFLRSRITHILHLTKL